ncbi:MAG TPA: SDR family oxidoreductase [Elusimicrobiota bacterium]|nr:SDR family oxidoreductase [Elusimicrobiota bacterium]
MTLMRGKVCLVTGANAGIGKETAAGLAVLGARVILACRDMKKAAAAKMEIRAAAPQSQVEAMRLDLADLRQVRAFARQCAEGQERLDVLINNAGVWKRRRETTKDGLEAVFAINHLGPAFLTLELLPLLKAGAPSRIVFVSSDSHYGGRMNWEDTQFEKEGYGSAAYRQSKLANVLFVKALARRLDGGRVTVNALHPGVVATDIGRDYPRWLLALAKPFRMTAREGARCSIDLAADPRWDHVTGGYFRKSKLVPASDAARNHASQERLWEATLAMLERAGVSAKPPA